MHTTNPQFDKWFNELEGFSFVSERFYGDLDAFAITHKNLESNPEKYYSAQIMMKNWLEAAFEAGKQCQ
jgi:hypothetical protein